MAQQSIPEQIDDVQALLRAAANLLGSIAADQHSTGRCDQDIRSMEQSVRSDLCELGYLGALSWEAWEDEQISLEKALGSLAYA